MFNVAQLSAVEFFKKVSYEDFTDKKVELLKSANRKDVKWIVDFMYNEKLDNTIYIPKFTPSNKSYGFNFITLSNCAQKVQIAVNHFKNGNYTQYERHIVNVLECLSEDEANLLVHILQGKKIFGISKSVFKKVYPQFFRSDSHKDDDSD